MARMLIQEKNRPSALVKLWASPGGDRFNLAAMRKNLDRYGNLFPVAQGVFITRTTLAGCPVEILTPKASGDDGVLVYVHGGGFVAGSITSHRQLASALAVSAQMKTLIFEYRLAPEHPYPAALLDCESVYRALLQQTVSAHRIGLIGDSAGGGLCLALQLRLKAAKAPLPGACVYLSPWVDLLRRGRSWQSNAASDRLVNAQHASIMTAWYLHGQSRCRAAVSPVYADLSGLPECLIHASSSEVLLDDARRLHARAQECGVPAQLRVWPNMPHVFHMVAPLFQDGEDAIDEIGQFLRNRLLGY